MKRNLIRVLVMGVGLLGLGAAQAGPGLIELKKAQLESLQAMQVHQRHGTRSQVCFGAPGFQICHGVSDARGGHKHRDHGPRYGRDHRHHGGKGYHGRYKHHRGKGYHSGHRHHGKGHYKKHRRGDDKHRQHRGKHRDRGHGRHG